VIERHVALLLGVIGSSRQCRAVFCSGSARGVVVLQWSTSEVERVYSIGAIKRERSGEFVT